LNKEKRTLAVLVFIHTKQIQLKSFLTAFSKKGDIFSSLLAAVLSS